MDVMDVRRFTGVIWMISLECVLSWLGTAVVWRSNIVSFVDSYQELSVSCSE